MNLTPVAFDVEDVPFRVVFAAEGDRVIAALLVDHPDYQVMGSVLTMAWKHSPVDLLENLVDGRELKTTELFRIFTNEDPDDEDEPLGVTLYEDEKELTVTPEFFHDVVVEFGGSHLDLVGSDHFSWWEDLSPAARALLEI